MNILIITHIFIVDIVIQIVIYLFFDILFIEKEVYERK